MSQPEMHIYGRHPVEEALERASDKVTEVIVDGDPGQKRWRELQSLANQKRVRIRGANPHELDDLADGGNHQGVVAGLEEYPYYSLAELMAREPRGEYRCLVALAQVQDPGNLGAILRSAVALGVDGVLIPKHRAAHITPTVIRRSAGLAMDMPVAKVTNLSRALRELKEERYWVVGTVAEEGQKTWEMDWALNAVVVMGGEHQGMRPGVEKECDFRLTIPLSAQAESLNVSAAAAIVLYDRLRSLETGA